MSILNKEIMRMKYAFAMHLVKNVIEADCVVVESEREFYRECFPEDLIRALDLQSPSVREKWLARALVELPSAMSLDERMDIFGMVLGASVVDGELEFREFGVLEVAAKALHIPQDNMMRYFEHTFESAK